MQQLVYLLKILLYYIVCIFAYSVLKSRRRFVFTFAGKPITQESKERSSLFWIVLVCLTFAIASVLYSRVPYASDRGNYAVRFENHYDSPWTLGLNTIANILYLVSDDARVLFFTVSFLYMILTYVAYHKYEHITQEVFIFLGVSQYFIFSFYLLKQAPAIALAAISMAYFMKDKYVQSILCLVLAVLFHESALVLIPLYMVMYGGRNPIFRWLGYISMAVCLFGFTFASQLVVDIITRFSPELTNQVGDYFDVANLQSGFAVTVLKGIPYYAITLIGFIKRPLLHKGIKYYDRYLILSVFVCVMTLLSSRMYWMFRFATYMYFPMFVFLSLILKENENKKENTMIRCGIGGTLLFLSARYLYQIFFWHGGF